MRIKNAEAPDDTKYLPLVLDTRVGARFTDGRGNYQLDVVTVNKDAQVAYRSLRLTHVPSGQVTTDPWQQGKNMAGNAKLIARACHWSSFSLHAVINGYTVSCQNCTRTKEVDYVFNGTLSKCSSCSSLKISVQERAALDYPRLLDACQND